MKLPALLTRNWGLKLLALVLALVIFYTVRESTHGRTYTPTLLKGVPNAPVTP